MQLTSQLDLLHQQLDIPSDNHNYILPTLCRNFLKKYQNRPHLHIAQLALDLKHVTSQIELYSQYTYETIIKYQSLHKLQVLVRGIIESQSSIIAYMANQINQTLSQRFNTQNKLEAMMNRVYQRCQTCMNPLRRANVQAIQDEMGLRFKDLYNYFMHDMDEISRLSEEASLIFRKKMLNIQGIAEEQYMQKFEKMHENVSTTIDHVTGSLNDITRFQQKFRELQEHQNSLTSHDRTVENKFDTKKYAINYSKHFNTKIQQLKSKLDRIRTFFVSVTPQSAQTQVDFSECSPQKIEELRKQIVDLEQDKKQAQIYSTVIDKQMKEDRLRFKNLQNNYAALKAQKQKLEQKARKLEIELTFVKDRYQLPSEKKFETDKKNTDNISKNEASKSIREQRSPKRLKSRKIIESEEAQTETEKLKEKDEIRNLIEKKTTKQPNLNPNSISRKQLQIGERDTNMKGYFRKTSKLKTDQYSEVVKEKNPNERKVKLFSQSTENLYKIEGEAQKSIQSRHLQSGRENTEVKTHLVEQQSQQYQHDQARSQIKATFTIQRQTEIKITPRGVGKNQNSNYIKSKFFEKLLSQTPQAHKHRNSNEGSSNGYLLQKIYNNSRKIFKNNVSLDSFKERIQELIKKLANEQVQQSQEVDEPEDRTKEELSRPQNNKNRSASRISIELKNLNKQVLVEPLHRKSGLGEKQLMKILAKEKRPQQRSKINTESNCQDPQKIINARQKLRKSINLADQIQISEKFILKTQKFSCFSNTDTFTNNNRAALQNLPLLKKKNQPENPVNIQTVDISQFQLVVGHQRQEFTQKDLRIIFHTLENAYEFGRIVLKHRKSQSCILGEDDLIHANEMGYIKQFFAIMANVHLNNKEAYDRIRLFIVAPYDSTVTQMTQLNLIKSGSTSSNAMRESLKKIILLHRNCVTRGEICKHLKYLLAKVSHFTANKQNNQS